VGRVEGKRNAENLTPHSRKERARPLSVPATEKFEGKLINSPKIVEPNSSENQKAKRSRKLRLPEMMRETTARSVSVPIRVSIKSS
jgi:hypothetical protein